MPHSNELGGFFLPGFSDILPVNQIACFVVKMVRTAWAVLFSNSRESTDMIKKLILAVAALIAMMGMAFAQVDVNKADAAALDGVKGIGPAISKKIVDERSKNGPFKDWADFETRVKGVGSKNAVKLSAAGLQVGGKSLDGAAMTAPAAAKPAVPPATAKPAAAPAAAAPAAKQAAASAKVEAKAATDAAASAKVDAKAAGKDAAKADAVSKSEDKAKAKADAKAAKADAKAAKAEAKAAKAAEAASAASAAAKK